eukprot:2195460-Pyramimonas_sp.AAC.2
MPIGLGERPKGSDWLWGATEGRADCGEGGGDVPRKVRPRHCGSAGVDGGQGGRGGGHTPRPLRQRGAQAERGVSAHGIRQGAGERGGEYLDPFRTRYFYRRVLRPIGPS